MDFARQRYWGEPVPCVYKEDGSIYFLPDDELPLVLPELEDYKGKNGKAPLENATEWKQYDRNGVRVLVRHPLCLARQDPHGII